MFSSFDFVPEHRQNNVRKSTEICKNVLKRGDEIVPVRKSLEKQQAASKFAQWRVLGAFFCLFLVRIYYCINIKKEF